MARQGVGQNEHCSAGTERRQREVGECADSHAKPFQERVNIALTSTRARSHPSTLTYNDLEYGQQDSSDSVSVGSNPFDS